MESLNIDFASFFDSETFRGRCSQVPGISSPVDIFLGQTADRNPIVFIVGTGKRKQFDSSNAIQAQSIHISESITKYSFELTKIDFILPFKKLIIELISVASHEKTSEAAMNRIEKRYRLWREFWKSGHTGLTRSEVLGVYGELLYVEELIKGGMEPSEVICSWEGPEDAPKDFELTKAWVEVKTISATSDKVKISSLEQLSLIPYVSAEKKQGRLIIYQVDFPSAPAGETLDMLVQRLLLRIEPDSKAGLLLEADLAMLGYCRGQGLSSSLRIQKVGRLEFLASSRDFPALRRENIPREVATAEYTLLLSSLSKWLLPD